MIKNYGFIKPDIDDTHYVLGGLISTVPKIIFQPNGDWRDFIPAYEPQFTPAYDTAACTLFGTFNALETLMKRLFGGDYDYAERFNYIITKLRPPGGDPHKEAESVRKDGVIEEALLPLTDTYAEFIKPDPMTADLIQKGQDWLKENNFLHEWVFTNNPDKATRVAKLKEALQYSPVALSVTAWVKDSNGLYIDSGEPNCHWVCCVALEEKDGEFYPIIIDSYVGNNPSNPSGYIKKLHPDHHIEFAKRYYVAKKPTLENKTLFARLLDALLRKLGLTPDQIAQVKKVIPF